MSDTPLRVRLFGVPTVEGGTAAHELLAQPKRLALLAFLALGRPGAWVRRDQLTAMFWPEHDEAHARSALRKALYAVRRVIGAHAVVSRGGEELGLDAAHVWVDAVAFDAAIAGGRYAEAQALYTGPLLDGVHADAPGFDEWLTVARRRFREEAVVCEWALAQSHERAEALTLAARHARRAARLADTDERTVRNAMLLLERAGDRAGALALYEECRDRLRRELDVEPSTETRALADAMRRK
ncbi:MAG: hypothetical protein HY275_12585 [Gemmatimonadetes bacterium]|nr:hypothetical protein [Gemmatimonadota bacterium]